MKLFLSLLIFGLLLISCQEMPTDSVPVDPSCTALGIEPGGALEYCVQECGCQEGFACINQVLPPDICEPYPTIRNNTDVE